MTGGLKMRFIYFMSVVLIIFPWICLASDTDQNLGSGIEFEIDENFTLTSFGGAAIAWKNRTSQNRGMRFGIYLFGEIGKREEFSSTPSDTLKEETDHGRFRTRVTIQKLFFSGDQPGVDLFIGLGPELGFSINENDEMDFDVRRYHSWFVGGAFSIGVEWRILHVLSVMAEYGIGLQYSYSRSERETDSGEYRSETTFKSFRFESRSVNFGITVYFR